MYKNLALHSLCCPQCETRPTLERQNTIGPLRFINRNMIIHFANQSQTCQLLKILTRSLYVASFLVIFFFFSIFSRSLYAASFLAIFIFFVTFSFSIPLHWIFPSHLHFHSVALLFIFPEFWKWSGAPFPFCIVLLPHFLALWQSVYFFLALSAKCFCGGKYLSTIACASEDTFGESTAAKFLLDNSPLFDMYGVPSRLSDYSLHVHLHSVCSIFQRMFCLSLSHLSPYHLFYELYQVSVAACHFSS